MFLVAWPAGRERRREGESVLERQRERGERGERGREGEREMRKRRERFTRYIVQV